MWILWKMRLWQCEFCEKWDFANVENVNCVKNWDFKSVNFVKNEIFKVWIFEDFCPSVRDSLCSNIAYYVVNMWHFPRKDIWIFSWPLVIPSSNLEHTCMVRNYLFRHYPGQRLQNKQKVTFIVFQILGQAKLSVIWDWDFLSAKKCFARLSVIAHFF